VAINIVRNPKDSVLSPIHDSYRVRKKSYWSAMTTIIIADMYIYIIYIVIYIGNINFLIDRDDNVDKLKDRSDHFCTVP